MSRAETSLSLKRTTTANKDKVTYRYLFTAFDFSIHNAAMLAWRFTARELHARSQLHSARRTRRVLINPNKVAAG